MQQEILLCAPDHFQVDYSINPWMKGETVCQKTALSQWLDLAIAIFWAGGKIHLIKPQPGLPDMVFTANAGVVHNGKFVVSNMKHKERKGESSHFVKWFQDNGYEIITIPEKFDFEGCGDVIVHKGMMLAGHGFRSNVLAHREAAALLDLSLKPLKLSDPRFYHLDTCFCVVDENLAIYYPGAFEKSEIKKLENDFELVPISEEDALSFVCNSLRIGSTLLIPAKETSVEKVLNEKGVETKFVDVAEFLKSGGSIQCLSLRV